MHGRFRMGCANSSEGEVKTLQVVPSPSSDGVSATSEKTSPARSVAAKHGSAEMAVKTSPPPTVELDMAHRGGEAEIAAGPPNQAALADLQASAAEKALNLKAFPLLEGWRVVFRLSQSDVRARWGSRPRPNSQPDRKPVVGSSFEAEVILPEASEPLKLPLQLLPQWIEPKVEKPPFLGRYKVVKELSSTSSSSSTSRAYEAFDCVERAPRVLQVRELMTEVDVRAFAQRLQLEALDSENKTFLKLREVFLALPGKVAAIEDLPGPSMWLEFERFVPGQELLGALASVSAAVLHGLSRLHTAGWVHCGLSPEQIFLGSSGDWMIGGLDGSMRVAELRNVKRLTRTGTFYPPEALLGLPQTEKVDLWQLAASLCECITRHRLDDAAPSGAEQGVLVAEKLCRLIDFVGPLPLSLLERHPQREELCTPEGHILRPGTPAADGTVSLQAVEPTARASSGGNTDVVRPLRLMQKLEGAAGATIIVDFLGWLLHHDPDQRPCCDEALGHKLLRSSMPAPAPGKKKSVNFGGNSAANKPSSKDGGRECRGVNFDSTDVEKENGIQRKGTGFVNMSDLPASDSEDDGEQLQLGKNDRATSQVQFKDSRGDNENTIRRKGTGYVQMTDLPPSDDEDEEEDVKPKPKVRIEEAEGTGSNNISRKGTGFVNLSDLPASDSEDDEDEAKQPALSGTSSVSFALATGDAGKNNIQRKGTGFVQMSDLPPSDDEDDEDEQVLPGRAAKKMHVAIQDSHGDNENKISRKGTGFVNMSDLPPSDDDEEDEGEQVRVPKRDKKSVQIAPESSGTGGKVARRGTGYVREDELPLTDEEEEEALVSLQRKERKGAPGHVTIKDTHGDNHNNIARKGTGFVQLSDLPPSDDEDEDDEEAEVLVGSGADKGQERSPKVGKRVMIKESPSQMGAPGADFTLTGSTHASEESPRTAAVRANTRKGTGIVRKADIPLSSDEEDES
mmetsp:Transcript_48089/g.112422  ORF Transcript_48089/g.112422 Transcript_48089/m.112422 type:complete len:963 (+) Transcript_48089:18-2906(+)